ncbi:MAG: 4-hydroxy-tetrahydrodipicolinate synthase [Tissierellales bacterium]|jgi:4-hydroxy-tetrahydrodipicolinate synthase|nr:4-hydroxy-tetrahydrodipicolinate synthase [Tissierellales bacterium]
MLFTGAATAIVTPFTGDGIDYESLDRIIEFQIENKIDAIVVAGTTGEAATLTDDEYKSLLKHTVERVAKRVPVIAGSGANNTQKAIIQSKWAEEAGVDGLLVVNPYYNKGTQKSLITHYKAIADSVNTPIVVYNVPGRTGMNISVDTIVSLSQIEGIVAVKEASGNFDQISEILRRVDDSFAVYSGNDNTVVPLLSLGGRGVISVVSNVMPRKTHDMVMTYLEGDVKESASIQHYLNTLVKALFVETNPIPVKKAMEWMGYCNGDVRLPLEKMTEETQPVLREAMISLNLLED